MKIRPYLRASLPLFALIAAFAHAEPGDILFSDDFERATLGTDWVVAGNGRAGIGSQTANSGTRSLFTANLDVTATLRVVDLSVPAARVEFWVRRGDDDFSEDTDQDDDVTVEYLNSAGVWTTLVDYDGGGTNGEIINASFLLPSDALHSAFQLRFRQLFGSGGPPENNGIGWDFWHFDDLLIVESADFTSGNLDCDTFDDGVGYTRVGGGSGVASVTNATFLSAPFSQSLNGEFVQVVSPIRDTRSGFLGVSSWVRRGADAFSENPDGNENLEIEYRADDDSWVLLDRFSGSDTPGEIFEPTYDLSNVPAAQHENFQIRLTLTDGSGPDFDFWHIDEICFIEIESVVASTIEVSHDALANYCAEELISIVVRDINGDPLSGYVGSISVTTNSGRGNWRLATGDGVFDNGTADDGTATYTFSALDDASIVLGLTYTSGAPSVDIDVTQTSGDPVQDDDSEGLLTFTPTGLTVTATALSNPPPATINDPLPNQIAGTDFVIHISAFAGSSVDVACGVIEDFAGARAIRFWQDWIDPTTSAGVSATIDGLIVGASQALATPQTVNFVAGQASVVAKYKDVGQLRINMRDEALALEGSTNAFVSRPADLLVTRVASPAGVLNPGATSIAVGEPELVPAGAPFEVSVEVRDAESDVTPNYGRESTPESIRVSSIELVAPVGGIHGSADDGTLINGDSLALGATAGVFESTTVAFDEFGIIRMQAQIGDGDYLGSGQTLGTPTGNIGRFGVRDFELTGATLTPSCGLFTYMSEPQLGVEFNLRARNDLGDTLLNYDGSLVANTALADVQAVAENDDSGINLGPRLAGLNGSWQTGVYAVATTAAEFSRGATLDGPFERLALGLDVQDPLDSRLLSNADLNATSVGDCVAAGNCTAASIGETEVYYGRLLAPPAQGPETTNLALDLVAQIWDGAGFVTHVADSCSRYEVAQISLQSFTSNLQAGETLPIGPVLSTPLLSGRADLSAPPLLSAPGIGNDGSAEVRYSVADWLRFDWLGVGEADPVATATFGRYRGHDRIVSWREVTR